MQERLGADERTSPWWGEHRSRYHFAAGRVTGLRVLDVACGSGHGLDVLADAGARTVLGVEIDPVAARTARRSHPVQVGVVRADGTALPIATGSIDFVASFETVEHVEADDRFVAELRRVLTPDGVAVISTPNARVTRPVDGVPQNPFHVREYTNDQFESLLRRHFSSVELLGQISAPEFGVCPYWQLPEDLPRDLSSRLGALLWKLGVRAPERVRDLLFRRVTGHGAYPGENDFVFEPAAVARAHVQVATCRP